MSLIRRRGPVIATALLVVVSACGSSIPAPERVIEPTPAATGAAPTTAPPTATAGPIPTTPAQLATPPTPEPIDVTVDVHPGPVIELELVVHIVNNEGDRRSYDSVRTSDDIDALVDQANAIWAQAGIAFNHRVTESTAAQTALSDLLLGESQTFMVDLLAGRIDIDEGGDVAGFMVAGLGTINGATPIGSRLFFLTDTPSVDAGRVMAHELGHILGLLHVDDPTLLMAPGKRGVLLDPATIDDLRANAVEIRDDPFR